MDRLVLLCLVFSLLISWSCFGDWSIPDTVGNVNTRGHDAYPCLTGDGYTLYFARFDTTTVGRWEIFYSNWDFFNQRWLTPVNIGSPINTLGNETTPFVSQNGNTLFFSAFRRQSGFGNWDLWYSQKSGGIWQTPVNLTTVNSAYNEYSPSLAPDETTLYFASDRPGGQGWMDIWKSLKVGGVWSTPVNLGARGQGGVNTMMDEQDPSLSPNGDTLLFSANYRVYTGDPRTDQAGWDLWKSTRNGNQWYTPVNLDDRIVNTNGFEFSPRISPDGQSLYFSSVWRPLTTSEPFRWLQGYDLWFSRQGPSPTTPVRTDSTLLNPLPEADFRQQFLLQGKK